MKAERLLSVLLLLQAHGRLQGRVLAERLEVSARTVHRDMEALGAAGVPVFATRGAQGGWQLDETWRTRVPGLDEAELRSLLMAQPRAIGDPRLAAAAERALGKLLAAMPQPLRDQAASIRQRLYVDPTGWRGATEKLSALPVVQDAVSRDRQLRIRYRRAGGDGVERTVHPLGLVATRTTWYLVARGVGSGDPHSAGFRTYRVSRIEEAIVLDAACERPARFDLAAHWKATTAQYREQRYTATLRLAPAAADVVRTWCDVVSGQAHERPDGDGWITLIARFDSEADACFLVLGLGARAEALGPASLRALVAREVASAFERLERPAAPRRDPRTSRAARRPR